MLNNITKISFLGLGVMGYPMAGHLALQFARAHAVNKSTDEGLVFKVYNRTTSKAKKWFNEYQPRLQSICPSLTVEIAETIKDVCQSEVLCLCVGGDADLQMIFFEQGLLDNLKKGALVIDHTTASAMIAKKLAHAMKSIPVGFIDAPISGGQVGAQQGTLSIMIGGEPIDFVRATPIMESYGKKIIHIGPVGSGQTTKMVNQICISGILQSLAEGLAFGKKANLNMEKVIEVIATGAAGSWQMQHRSHTMLEGKYNFGFAVKWMIKDLNIALDEAGRLGVDCDLAKQILSRYETIAKKGGESYDTSSLMTLTDK